jgi:hypothetical protein
MALLLLVLMPNGFSADAGYIFLRSGKKLTSSDITADAEGNIFYLSSKGRLVIPKDMVKYVIVNRPAALLEAQALLTQGSYEIAAKHYATLAKKYRFLGWYLDAVVGQVTALQQQGKNREVELLIKPLLSYKSSCFEHEEPFLLQAYQIYAEVLLSEQHYEALVPVIYRLKRGSDGELSAWAFNIAGKRLVEQQKYREAAREFIQPVLLYGRKNRQRCESLQLLIDCLAKFDKKLSIFYLNRLKNEYNDSTLSSYR